MEQQDRQHQYITCGVATKKQQLYRRLHMQNPQISNFNQVPVPINMLGQLQANVVSLENALNESEAKLKEAELAKGILEKKRENEVKRERELRMVFEAAKIDVEQQLRKELLTLKEENWKKQMEANERDVENLILRRHLESATKKLADLNEENRGFLESIKRETTTKIKLKQYLRKEHQQQILALKEENRKRQEETNARDLEMAKLREQLQASTKYLDRIVALERELKASKKEADENRELLLAQLNQSRKEADEIQAKYDQLTERMEELEVNTIANANVNAGTPPEESVKIVDEVNRGDFKWLPAMKREEPEKESGGTVTIDEEEPTTRKHPIQDFLMRQVKKEEPRQEEEEEQRPTTSGGHQVRENNAGPSNNNSASKNKMLLRERKQRPNYYGEPRVKKMKR